MNIIDIIINITISFYEPEAWMSSCQQLLFSFISFNVDKIISGTEINSILRIKQQRVKKSHKICPEPSVKSIKHKYESVAGVKSELIHGYFLMLSCQKCRTAFLEKEYEWLSLTIKIF